MASSYMLRPLCTSHLSHASSSPQDRVCCYGVRRRRRNRLPIFGLRCRRNVGLWTDFSPLPVKLTAPSASIDGVVLPQGNLTGQVNVVTNAEVDVQVSTSPLVDTPLASDESTGSNNGVALGPAPDPGPDFDYQVYAMNTMVGYEPPPPPRIPFGGPFEDYYDEYVGVDYVPKQEKPTSSFLMFLDSLNEKRAEEEAKLREKDPSRPPFDPKPNKHLFAGSKPLFTIPRPTHPAPLPREYIPPSLDPNEPTSSRTFSSSSSSGLEGRQRRGKPTDDGVVYEVPTSVTLPIDLEDIPSKQEAKPTPGATSSGVFEESSSSSQTSTTSTPSQIQPDTSAAATAFSPPPQASSSVAEEPEVAERPLIPSLRPIQGGASGMPLSSSTTPKEASSTRPLSPTTVPSEAPVDASGSLFPQNGSVGEVQEVSRQVVDSVTPQSKLEDTATVPQSGLSEETKEDKPFIFQRKPIEESSPLSPQNRPQEETKEERTLSFESRPVEESQPVIPQSTPLKETKEERPFIFLRPNMEEKKPPAQMEETMEEKPVIFSRPNMEDKKPLSPPVQQPMPSVSGQYMAPQGSFSAGINGSDKPLFPQTQPTDVNSSVPQGWPRNEMASNSWSPSQSIPLGTSTDTRQGSPPTIDGMVQQPFPGQFTPFNAPGVAPPVSEFYEPVEGDIVLGVVTYANEDEVGLEIGGRVPALMTMREFQPLAEIGDSAFFKIPLSDDSNESTEGFVPPPLGKIMLVEDNAANDGVYRGENVNIGTIVTAAVQSRDLIDGRPVVTCRRLAKSLAFVRIEQLMRTGEAIQLEITQYNDGGLQGYLEGVRAFLPRSELLRRPENIMALQDYVGKTLTVAILQAEEYASNVIISEVKCWMSKNLLLGSVHNLTITRIYPYGMQVEVENTRVRGFIHISNITRGYVTSLNASFVEGEKMKAMVIRGRKPGQLSFSLEALEPPDNEGLVLRNKEQVYEGAEEVAKSSQEYQLAMEDRQVFAMPYGATTVNVRDTIANLPWLRLEAWQNSP